MAMETRNRPHVTPADPDRPALPERAARPGLPAPLGPTERREPAPAPALVEAAGIRSAPVLVEAPDTRLSALVVPTSPAEPTDVRKLVAGGTARARVLPDGRIVADTDGREVSGGTSLLKDRVWGQSPWYERLPERIRQEAELMGQRFPQFVLQKAEEACDYHGWTVANPGQLFWIGRLRVHSGTIYGAAVTYPDGYPHEQPRAFVIDPYIPATKHRYGDGHLCLYSNDHGGAGEGFTPEVTTAVTFVAWVAAWLHAYEIYRAEGTWPEAIPKKGPAAGGILDWLLRGNRQIP